MAASSRPAAGRRITAILLAAAYEGDRLSDADLDTLPAKIAPAPTRSPTFWMTRRNEDEGASRVMVSTRAPMVRTTGSFTELAARWTIRSRASWSSTAAMARSTQFFVDARRWCHAQESHRHTGRSMVYRSGDRKGRDPQAVPELCPLCRSEGLKNFFETVQFSLIPVGDKSGKANTLTHPIVYLLTKHDDKNKFAIAATDRDRVEPRINALHAIKQHIWHLQTGPNILFWQRSPRAKPRAVAAIRQRHAQQLKFRRLLGRDVEGTRGRWTGQKSLPGDQR